MDNFILLISLLVGIPGGIVTGYYARKRLALQESSAAEAKAQAIINEAKVKQKQLLVEAQEKSLEVIEQAKKEEASRRREMRSTQDRLEKRETLFDQRLLDFENRSQRLNEKATEIENLKQQILDI